MEELLPLLAEAQGGLKDFTDTLKQVASEVGEVLMAPLKLATEATDAFASGIKAATGAIMGPFQALAGAVGPFVAALNPQLMYGLNQAFRSLMATIGTALMPVVEVMISGIRRVAGILLPAMQGLAPVFDTLTRVVMTALSTAFDGLASIVEALTPAFQFVADALGIYVDSLKPLVVITKALWQTIGEFIKSFFGGADAKDFLKGFKDAIHQVVEGLLTFTAYLAKSLGALGFIDKMVANLRDLAAPKVGAAPAPTDVGIKGFEDIAKTMATAAFAAQGGAGGAEDKSEKEWLAKLAGDVGDIAKNNKTLGEVLTDFWDKKIWVALAASAPFRLGGRLVEGIEALLLKIPGLIRRGQG